jgi:hypothetical protein
MLPDMEFRTTNIYERQYCLIYEARLASLEPRLLDQAAEVLGKFLKYSKITFKF